MQSFALFQNILLGGVPWFLLPLSDFMGAKDLVERCKRGDGQAMGLLYSMYVHKIEQVCRRYIKDELDVQDIVHDSFVVIFTSLDKLKDYGKLESWMCTIARNLSLKHLQRPVLADMEKADDREISSQKPDFPDYDRLMTLVEQLPAGYKNVLKLSVLEGLSHKEIGEMLGIGSHSSSSQLARAKELMRKRIVRYGLLLVALLIAFVSFPPTEDTEPETKIAEKHHKPKRPIGAKDSTERKEAEEVAYPLIAKRIDTVAPAVSVPTFGEEKADDSPTPFVAEAVGNDSTTEASADTMRTEPRAVPNVMPSVMPDDVLVAEDVDIKKEADEWILTVAFAGGNGNQLASVDDLFHGQIGAYPPFEGTDSNDPGVLHPAPDTLVNTSTRHLMPLIFSISLGKELSPRWSVEAGLRYTLLRSETLTTKTLSNSVMPLTVETTMNKAHYIGIPLKATYSFWRSPSFSLYTSAGMSVDVPFELSNPMLLSVSLGAGVQYKITPNVSLYTEPSLNRFLNINSEMSTIRSNRPFEFTIPIGIRLSW